MGRPSLLIALLIASIGPQLGCKKGDDDKNTHESTPAEGAGKSAPPKLDTKADFAARELLVPMAEAALTKLADLEKVADVTCWTSFRQLDWYIAEKTYSEFATLAKVTAIKGLVRALWVEASSREQTKTLTPESIQKVLESLPPIRVDASNKDELSGFANDIGLRNFTDYEKTAEQWRVVISVIEDEIFYGSGKDTVKVASSEGLDALADGATTLSLHRLKRSGALAVAAKTAEIEAAHVKAAFGQLGKELGLKNTARKVSSLAHKDVGRLLAPLTRKLIEGKGEALVSFNRASGDLARDLSRVSELPIDADGAAVFYNFLKSFARFATSGADPMRADNYLSDGSFEKSRIERKPYLDHLQLQNVVQQVFPHKMLANGDILVRFEPNPGPMTNMKFEPFEIRLLDHRMNGVRDSAVHWKVLADLYSKVPFAIDPFAAEYLSEVASMMMALFIERAVRLAKKQGRKTIDRQVASRIMTKTFVQVPVTSSDRPAWDRQWAVTKAAALAAAPKQLFVDVTKSSGLPQTIKVPGADNAVRFNIQTIMGGGVGVADVNRDGYPDLYMTGEGLGRLFLNRGSAAPGTFIDATAQWKLPTTIDDGHGALFFDLEGDGDDDLLVLRSDHSSALFVQEGGGFVDASRRLGFKTGRGAHSAHVFDYDGDGDLDVYVGYYGSKRHHADPTVESLPAMDGRNGSPNQLWRNDGGKFVSVAASANVADLGWTLAIGSFDLEGDGDLDLYLANDFGANAMYINRGDGTFVDATEATQTGDRGSGMNVDFADLNGDGRWDLYVTNNVMFSKRIKVVFPRDTSTIDLDRELAESFQYLSGNKLYVSSADGRLVASEEQLIEPGDRGWGWDALFFDYENDGDRDLYVSNGWVDGSYAGSQKNQMFVFDQVFHLAAPNSAEAVAGNTRSVAAADFDRDGDIDLVLNQFRKAPVMLRNNQSSKNRWIRIALANSGGKTNGNPAGIGAEVTVTAAGKKILNQVTAGRGYISQTETTLLVGVGRANTVEVSVRWPNNTRTEHKALKTNQLHTLSP